MDIDRELILKLEKLSRLRLSEEERTKIQEDLHGILNMIEKLDELDMAEEAPLRHMTAEYNNMRNDEAKESLPIEVAQSIAPAFEDRFFKVPKVINK